MAKKKNGAMPAGGTAPPRQVEMIPVAQIDRCGKNRDSAHDGAIPQLAGSIARDGLINPITLRRLENGRYEIVTGERRWRAFLHLDRVEIPAVVKDIGVAEAQIERLMENLMRKDLEPFEKGDGIAALLETNNHDYADAAGRVGWSESWVRRLAKLPKLIPSWREALEADEDGDYPHIAGNVEKMAEIAVLPPDTQQLLLDKGAFLYARTVSAMRRNIARALMRIDMKPWDYRWEESHYQGHKGAAPQKQRCKACSRRSDRDNLFAPVLAEGEGMDESKVYCLDPACWEAKTAAWCAELLARNPDAKVSWDGSTGHELGAECARKYGERWLRTSDWMQREENTKPGSMKFFTQPDQLIFIGGVRAGQKISIWRRSKKDESREETAGTEREGQAESPEEETREEEPYWDDATEARRQYLEAIIPTEINIADMNIAMHLLRWAVFFGLPSVKTAPANANMPTSLSGPWDSAGVFWRVLRSEIIGILLGLHHVCRNDANIVNDARISIETALGISLTDPNADGNSEEESESEGGEEGERNRPATNAVIGGGGRRQFEEGDMTARCDTNWLKVVDWGALRGLT